MGKIFVLRKPAKQIHVVYFHIARDDGQLPPFMEHHAALQRKYFS
jgi:hypothetical protein